MIRIPALTVAALVAFAAPVSAQTVASLDQEHPTLRAEATVTGEVVRIGDLIDHAGIVANVPIFRSPDLGSTGTVSADAVQPSAPNSKAPPTATCVILLNGTPLPRRSLTQKILADS